MEEIKTAKWDWHRLIRWLIFSLSISILPFGLRVILCLYFQGYKQMNFYDYFKDGELLLVTCALAAETIGELVGVYKQKHIEIQWILACGMCLLCAIISSFGYGLASIKTILLTIQNLKVEDLLIAKLSLVFFFSTFVVAGYVKVRIPE
ncbi:MAG: hypothetical protein N3B18_01645 [Desulfobacterota bacterium]|nr:hypothetical protein [Thermodesulfobacteriota bacterium]